LRKQQAEAGPPAQAKEVALLGSLDHAIRELVVH
jgi:hypothetical protein